MFRKILWRLVVVTLGLLILFLSVARAGLTELVAQEGGIDLLKNNEISFLVTFDSGDTMNGAYRFPEVTVLPDNLMYGFKMIRDYFWLTFSSSEDKVKIALLMADKKTMEFSKLAENDKYDRAVEAGNEAIDKLEYATGLAGDSKSIRQKILMAGFAYKEIFRQPKAKFDLDTDKYLKLISRIDDWNKEQEKNRYNWDY